MYVHTVHTSLCFDVASGIASSTSEYQVSGDGYKECDSVCTRIVQLG